MPNVPLTPANLEYLVERYSRDIEGFAIDVCGFERLDPWQKWLLKTLVDPEAKDKLAIASCHSSGKTLLSSVVALHRLTCYPQARVTITSATEAQLKSAFVTTIQSVIENSLISDWFNVSAEQITLKGLKGAWIKLRTWSKSKPESIAGVHCLSPLFITDEASGIDDAVFDAIEGSMMHENSKLLMLGNPLHRRGKLFDAFHGKKEYFETFQVSAHDSSFISDSWIEEMRDEYGADSNIYKVRVLGQFPDVDIDAYVPADHIRAAEGRSVHVDKMEAVVAGLDVGKYHDASVLCIRQGHKVRNVIRYRTRDLMTLSHLVSKEILNHNIERIAVDANGIGSGVADRLRQSHGRMVFDVQLGNFNVARSKEFYNGRAELWGKAKKWLNYGAIPRGTGLVKEGSTLLYDFDDHGRYRLERKKDAFKRGIGSPDEFDAFSYTFAIPTAPAREAVRDTNVDISWY